MASSSGSFQRGVIAALVIAQLGLVTNAARFNGQKGHNRKAKSLNAQQAQSQRDASVDSPLRSAHHLAGELVQKATSRKPTAILPEAHTQDNLRQKHTQDTLGHDFVDRIPVAHASKQCGPADRICHIQVEARNLLDEVLRAGKWLLFGSAPFFGADFVGSILLMVIGVGALAFLVRYVHGIAMCYIQRSAPKKCEADFQPKYGGPFDERNAEVSLDRLNEIRTTLRVGRLPDAKFAKKNCEESEDEVVPNDACDDEWEPWCEAWEVESDDDSVIAIEEQEAAVKVSESAGSVPN